MTFSKEESLINDNITPRDIWENIVYTKTEQVIWAIICIGNLRGLFSDRDSDPVMAEGKRSIAYYDYDVFMGISDYNRLREMLNLTPVTLRDDQYLIHIANRVYQEIKDKSAELPDSLNIGLDFAGFKTEGLAQNGHNGTDYLLVVPDKELAGMKKYFFLMAVMANGDVPENLSECLYDLAGKVRGYDELADYIRIGSEELFFNARCNTSQKPGGFGTKVFNEHLIISFILYWVSVFMCIPYGSFRTTVKRFQ